MRHEIGQPDISDRQLMATNAQPRVGMWTDIGEAKITHTIFGRAKVRIIHEHDKTRRAWLLTALAVAALAIAVWQGWIASQQTEPLQSAVPPPPLSARDQVSAPTFQPEYIPPTATPPSVKSKPDSPPQTEINNPAISLKSAPQQPPGSKGTEQMAVKPVTAQPLKASKPQTAPLATNNNALLNQTDMQQPPKLSATIQPVTTIVATPPTTQPLANSPATVAPPVEPLVEEDTSTQSPAGDNQPTDSVNAQP